MAVNDSDSPSSLEQVGSSRPERPAPVQKRSTLSKLGRMFSQKDTTNADKDAMSHKNNRQVPETAIEETDEPVSSPPQASSSSTTSTRPANPTRQSSQTGGISTNGITRNGSTSRHEPNLPPQRFWIDENGEHHHLYKHSRRQEKLMGMLRDFVSGKKKEHHEEQPLSLMSSWLDQMRSEKHKSTGDKAGGPNASATLVQKYGKCQEVVGKGAFGIVRIAHKIDPNDSKHEQLYAVKEFVRRPDENSKKYAKRLNSEFCISSSLRHPNVIRTLDLLEDAKGDFCQVMEYCAGGDMYTLVMVAHKLEVVEADCLFLQLMRGVEYMHEMGVAHRDLKPENLLLTTHGALKITDFGNGECFRMAWETEPHLTQGLCGSAPYIAPEEYTEKEFDPRAVDVWACGVIYMAMRSGRHLWHQAKAGEDEYFDHYLEGRRSEEGYGPIEQLHRARCRNVVYSILDPIASRRITASQVLKSEWCKNIQICKAGEEGL